MSTRVEELNEYTAGAGSQFSQCGQWGVTGKKGEEARMIHAAIDRSWASARTHLGSFPGVCVHPAVGTHACVSLLCQLRDSRSEDSPEHSSPPEFSFQHYSLRRGTRDPWRRGWYWGKAYKMDLEHLAGPESRNLLEEDQGRPRERPVAKARTIRATEQSSIGSKLKYKTSNHEPN